MDSLDRAINDIKEAGFDAKETLTGYFIIDAEMLDREGAIGEEYCWMHSGVGRGGWTCYACNLAAFFEALSQQLCPFCPLFLPEETELWEQIGDEFFGSPAIFEDIHCCDGCYSALHLMSNDGNEGVQQMVAQVRGEA